MGPSEAVMVWGFIALLAMFVGTLWVVQGRMLRRERAREESLLALWRKVADLEETVLRLGEKT